MAPSSSGASLWLALVSSTLRVGAPARRQFDSASRRHAPLQRRKDSCSLQKRIMARLPEKCTSALTGNWSLGLEQFALPVHEFGGVFVPVAGEVAQGGAA